MSSRAHSPIADAFIELFAYGAAWRRPILLIVGGTNLGKSMLAGDIQERVATWVRHQLAIPGGIQGGAWQRGFVTNP